jgi:hypothetical protein
MNLLRRWFALALVIPALACAADDQPPSAESQRATIAQFESSLH